MEVKPEVAQAAPDDEETVKISNRDRVIYPESGQTKGQLADYYEAVAPLMLPWAAHRPLTLVRCPQGRAKKCFFQKHDSGTFGEHVHHVPIVEKDGHAEDYMGEDELYFCCTSGGAAKLGQVFRLRPQVRGGQDRLQLFFESTSKEQFNYGDNLTVAPNGHLVVCEDQYTDVVENHLRGITPAGEAYPLALSRVQTEWAGACFSPDGKWLFVNLYKPAKTIAIAGPWMA